MDMIDVGFRELIERIIDEPRLLGMDYDQWCNTRSLAERVNDVKSALENMNPLFRQDQLFQKRFITIASIVLIERELAKKKQKPK